MSVSLNLSNTMDFSDTEPEEMDINEQLEKNRRELQEYLASSAAESSNDTTFGEYQEALQILKDLKAADESNSRKKFRPNYSDRPKRKPQTEDPAFRFFGRIPVEVRKSSRLQKKDPQFSYYDLADPNEVRWSRKRKFSFDDLDELKDLTIRFAAPKKKRLTYARAGERDILQVEDVTEEMLNNICLRVKDKKYSDQGTTCHQCRQKTIDQKTCCRNINCVGLAGQFCGVCIINRYGETARDALLDPNWHCFKCRGICNCSICRNREGKLPTGQLVPLCQERGAKSVRHLLDELNGKYDYGDEEDEEELIGFSDSGRLVHYSNNRIEHFLTCKICYLKEFDNPTNLLGFSDQNTAHMGGGVITNIQPDVNGYSNVKQFRLFNYLDMKPAYFGKAEKMKQT